MQQIIKYSVISVILVSCGTAENSRYRDTSLLERPPTLVIQKSPGEPYQTTDDSSIPKKQEPGLGDAVSITESAPPQLKIRQSYDKAWTTLNQALKLNNIKITDHERNKGHIYVGYGSTGLFEKVASFLKDEQKDPIYLLLLKEDGVETTVTATPTNPTDQTSSSGNPDSYDDKPSDDSEELLQALYKTIRDDSVDE
jgi:hypothetical protein